MNCIEFEDVSFTYPAVDGDLDENGKSVQPKAVFSHFTGAIPSGGGAHFTSLIGPNGSGKSTFLLLASGRLVPQEGRCMLLGQDVARLPQDKKNLLASVIYQNMEFESKDKVEQLLAYVFANGALKGNAKGVHSSSKNLLDETIETFELQKVLSHGLTELSKGEIQRTLLAFSLLYGSASVFMDEPMFAMEERQKQSSLAYLREYAEATGTAVFVSMHELDLTRKFAQKVILFYPNRDMDYGTPDEVMTDADLEKAYGVPAAMLKKQEDMTREELKATADAILQMQK